MEQYENAGLLRSDVLKRLEHASSVTGYDMDLVLTFHKIMLTEPRLFQTAEMARYTKSGEGTALLIVDYKECETMGWDHPICARYRPKQ